MRAGCSSAVPFTQVLIDLFIVPGLSQPFFCCCCPLLAGGDSPFEFIISPQRCQGQSPLSCSVGEDADFLGAEV